MADKDTMQRVDMKKEFSKLSSIDQHYIKKAESLVNKQGVKQKVMSKKNYAVAGGLFLMVAGIYSYTIRSIKQERFLDEYDDMHKK